MARRYAFEDEAYTCVLFSPLYIPPRYSRRYQRLIFKVDMLEYFSQLEYFSDQTFLHRVIGISS